MNLNQTFRIKRLLAGRKETITSLARALNRPYGSVANNIYGYRHDPGLKALIAEHLGEPVDRLFSPPGDENKAQAGGSKD